MMRLLSTQLREQGERMGLTWLEFCKLGTTKDEILRIALITSHVKPSTCRITRIWLISDCAYLRESLEQKSSEKLLVDL